MSQQTFLSSIANQWASTALCSILKDAHITPEIFQNYFESACTYANDMDYYKSFTSLPKGYVDLTDEDISAYRITYEIIMAKFLNELTASDVMNYTSFALKNTLVIAARVMQPDKAILRAAAASPIKSGIHIPKSFYPKLTPYLSFIQKVIEKVTINAIGNIDSRIFSIMIDILLRRPHQSGPEGLIISQLSPISKVSQQINAFLVQIVKIKETPKIKVKFNFLVEGIKCIRYQSKTPDEVQVAYNNFKEWVNILNSLKGKWTLQMIIPIISESFIYFFEHTSETTSVHGIFSMYWNFVFQNATSNPTAENLQQMMQLLHYINDSDFQATAAKIYQVLTKNLAKLTTPVYFQFLKIFVDAASAHNGVGPELFNMIIGNWFVTAKDKTLQINPAYKDNPILIINIFPMVYSMTPVDTEEFFVKLITNQPTLEMSNFVFSTLHYISIKSTGLLTKPISALAPFIKGLMNEPELNNDTMQLVVPLFTLFWKNCSDLHSDITNLCARLIKSQDVTVLGNIATFFSDVMSQSQGDSMPVKLLVSFAGQFIKNFDEITNDSVLSRNFTFYLSFVKSFLDYRKRNPVDNVQWQQFLSPTETRLLIFAMHPNRDVRIIAENIWDMLNDENGKDSASNLASTNNNANANSNMNIINNGSTPIVSATNNNNDSKYLSISNILNSILKCDRKTFIKVASNPEFGNRYRAMTAYFIKMNNSQPTFKNSIAQFLIIMFKSEYFDQNSTQIRDQLISMLVPYLKFFEASQVYRLISLSDTSSWKFFGNELAKQTNILLSDRIKYAWAISSHSKFSSVVNTNQDLLRSLPMLFNEFLASELPKDESEQLADVIGSEFCATLIRSITGIIKVSPFKNINALIEMIISRLNPDSITLPDISHVFALLELMHALLDAQPLEDDVTIENVLDWTLYIALKTKGSTLLQLKCHDVVKSLVIVNPNSLPLIMRCCFRSSSLTTTHVASAIADVCTSSQDLAILSLGLSSRPSMICRAMSAEIANKSGASFSPLACIDPYFEEKLIQFFSSSFNPEAVRLLMLQLPPMLKATENDPLLIQHYNILSNRLNVCSIEIIKYLFKLTSVAEFADLSPIKPLIPIWDKVFTNPPSGVDLNTVLQQIIDLVPSATDSKAITAACIAFSRAFFKFSKQTATFLLNHLRVVTDPSLAFDDLRPNDTEIIVSAILSFIFAMETEQQRFVVSFLDKIQYILVWAIFLRFNPLYEHYQLPPLITSVMHAAVPNSALPLFVMAPSECVARAIYLPFRHTTEFTIAQMQSLLETLRLFSKLTAELFLDLTANKAVALAKYSDDFWFLFSNFFQQRHSTNFLNVFIDKSHSLDLGSVAQMLPILTGVVKQGADPMHIGGFITVLASVAASTDKSQFVRKINEHLHVFTETVIKSDNADTISSTFSSLLDEQGGETAMLIGVLSYLEHADRVTSMSYGDILSYLREIARLIAISGPKFSAVSLILYCFDSIRKLESNGTEQIVCNSILGLGAPKSYDELVETIVKSWTPKLVQFLVSYLATFIGKSAVLNANFKRNLLNMLCKLSSNWTSNEFMPNLEKLKILMASCTLGAEEEKAVEIVKIFEDMINVTKIDPKFNLMEFIKPLRVGKGNEKFKRAVSACSAPSFVDYSIIMPITNVCDYVQSNILS